MVAGEDDGTGAQEEQSLEPCVGEEVEHGCLPGQKSQGHDHIAELGEGGVGQDAFDVILLGGHEGGDDGRNGSDAGNDIAGQGGEGLNADGVLDAHHHVNAGGYHGGRMDQGGDGGGAFHGVRKPDVQRELGGFAHRSAEEAQYRNVQQVFTDSCGYFHQAEIQRVGQRPESQNADQEAEVPDAVADEGFFGGVGGSVPCVPVADKQIGGEAHQFPEDKGHGDVVRQDDARHGEHEKAQACEVACFGLVVRHVSQRENMDQQADARDHQHHAGGKGIQHETQVHGKDVGNREPGEGIGSGPVQQTQGKDEGRQAGEGGGEGRDVRTFGQQEPVKGGYDQRQEEQKPGVLNINIEHVRGVVCCS